MIGPTFDGCGSGAGASLAGGGGVGEAVCAGGCAAARSAFAQRSISFGALLAMGLVDIVIETGLKPYDIQALIPLIESAGGAVTDWRGGSCADGGDVLACGDRALHAELLKRIANG